MKPLPSLMKYFFAALCFLMILSGSSQAQFIPVHISDKAVYEFLEEMAGEHLIQVTSVAKPWSRIYIAQKLSEIADHRDNLTPRQQKELNFYLKDFGKELKPDKNFNRRLDLFYYKDSLFSLTVNPIGGFELFSNAKGSAYHWWNGAEAFASVDNWGFYASLRDNHESERLSKEAFITQRMGANYKGNNDYSEMRGGVTYSWKWGSAALAKDHFSWGTNTHGSNIFSGRTPSFPFLNLELKPVHWFTFRFIEGWLISEVVDSSRSYWVTNSYGTDYREVYHPKYLSANLFTFTPWNHTSISFGNSIIYTDIGLHTGYLIPMFFFKSVDHTVNAGIDNQNSQMFFDLSTRFIKHTHLYATLFVDEISTSRMFDPDKHSNFISIKVGTEISNFPLKNVGLQLEYTRTNPLTYRHYVPTLTFESNRFNLGNYLLDNSREYFVSAWYKPLRGVLIKMAFNKAQKGPDYTQLGSNRLGLPFLESIEWENSEITLSASYQLINSGYLFSSLSFRNITDISGYVPDLFMGKTTTFSMGMNFGF